jgi:hypothetical protein
LPISLRLRSNSLALEPENQTILPVILSVECNSSLVKNFKKNRLASRGVTGDSGLILLCQFRVKQPVPGCGVGSAEMGNPGYYSSCGEFMLTGTLPKEAIVLCAR